MRCAASPAGTAASSSPDAVGSARSASTRTARCTCRPATSRRCSAIPPRRSRSSMRSWTDCYKIDSKAMEDRRYRELGGVLQHVLDAIRMVYERGFWLELVTLVVPGFNDDDAQLRRAADYIASVSPEIPWHVTAFHKDYRMTDPDNTSAETLLRACEIGAAAGLKFVYAGNLPGRVGRWEHTWCPDCGELLIERHGYVIQQQRIGVGGDCVACGRRIPGVWS